jgi:hypothetical protein
MVHKPHTLKCPAVTEKPNWLALSRPLSSMCPWTIFRITFLNSLPVVDKRLIGCKFGGILDPYWVSVTL